MLAGGVESMTRAPLVMPKPERGFPRGNVELADTTLGWRLVNPRMASCTRPSRWARRARTWRSATASRARTRTRSRSSRTGARSPPPRPGGFDDEIVTVDVPQPKGEPVTVHSDEGPRPDTTLERLAKLKPIFREGGTVTAGNSSSLNDGAACLVLASEERASELGREPLARIVATGSAGVDPGYMGIGPVPASAQGAASAPGSRSTRSTWSS